jgi:hypothetical protein
MDTGAKSHVSSDGLTPPDIHLVNLDLSDSEL